MKKSVPKKKEIKEHEKYQNNVFTFKVISKYLINFL